MIGLFKSKLSVKIWGFLAGENDDLRKGGKGLGLERLQQNSKFSQKVVVELLGSGLVFNVAQFDSLDRALFYSYELVQILLILLKTELQISSASVIFHQNQLPLLIGWYLELFVHFLELLVLAVVEQEALLHGLEIS